ncbi:MAG: thioredoxin [Lachnospiraceae bacterium]|nr:thioredoxin [Lachnospiraceae bacterium]
MSSKAKKMIRLGGILVSGVFVLYGVVRGEAGIVLNKAVNICFECIGLG